MPGPGRESGEGAQLFLPTDVEAHVPQRCMRLGLPIEAKRPAGLRVEQPGRFCHLSGVARARAISEEGQGAGRSNCRPHADERYPGRMGRVGGVHPGLQA